MKHAALVMIALAGLAACSQPADPEPAAPVAIEARQWNDVYAAAQKDPETFVRTLYAFYAEPQARELRPAKGRDPLYSRVMNALIGEDERLGKNHLDHDPVCGCQPGEAVRFETAAVTAGEPNTAEAVVVFAVGQESRRQTLKLVKEGPMWRIADVIVEGVTPLSEQLYAAIG
jgi:hypothetical protein